MLLRLKQTEGDILVSVDGSGHGRGGHHMVRVEVSEVFAVLESIATRLPTSQRGTTLAALGLEC